jgi:hypothetical protein
VLLPQGTQPQENAEHMPYQIAIFGVLPILLHNIYEPFYDRLAPGEIDSPLRSRGNKVCQFRRTQGLSLQSRAIQYIKYFEFHGLVYPKI